MPLVAELDGNRVDSTKLTREEWDALSSSSDRVRIVMPDCRVRAIMKRSVLGLQHFAHHSVAGCDVVHRPESPQHLAMKAAIADAIDSQPGWSSIVEARSRSGEWIADVLAVPTGQATRVAFEVQLSAQSPDEYAARTQRYFDHGIFPVWLTPNEVYLGRYRIPVAATGFGKSSELPTTPAELLDLPVQQTVIPQSGDLLKLGGLIEKVLDGQWGKVHHESPTQQKLRHEEEDRLAEDLDRRMKEAAEQERLRLAELDRKHREADAERQRLIAEIDLTTARPQPQDGTGHIVDLARIFVWASETGCPQCRRGVLVWNAQFPTLRRGVISLHVKEHAAPKRTEELGLVQRAVDEWLSRVPAAQKARIESHPAGPDGKPGALFVCPHCGTPLDQRRIALIKPAKWSLIAQPGGGLPPRREPRRPPSPDGGAAPKPRLVCGLCGGGNSGCRRLSGPCAWMGIQGDGGIP